MQIKRLLWHLRVSEYGLPIHGWIAENDVVKLCDSELPLS